MLADFHPSTLVQIDVSNVSNLHPGADNTISYRAYGYDPNTGDFVPPDDPGGYMRVTSQWVWLE